MWDLIHPWSWRFSSLVRGPDRLITLRRVASTRGESLSQGNCAIAIHASDRLFSLGRNRLVWSAPFDRTVFREIVKSEMPFLDSVDVSISLPPMEKGEPFRTCVGR